MCLFIGIYEVKNPSWRTFNKARLEAPFFVRTLASCSFASIQNSLISFLSIICLTIDISTLSLLSLNVFKVYAAWKRLLLSVLHSIARRVLFSLYIISAINLDIRKALSAPSTRASVSAASVDLTTLPIFVDLHAIGQELLKESVRKTI